MPKHHTNDPAVKAADIANREAEKAYRSSMGQVDYYKKWLEIYPQLLMEMHVGLPEENFTRRC